MTPVTFTSLHLAAAPYSTNNSAATHKDCCFFPIFFFFFFFLKVCSACYHEWAPGLRNPITSSVSEHCCHSHVYRSHVPQIRNDVPISCSSLLQFSLPPLTQCVSLIEAAVHLRGCCSAHSDSDSASSTAGASTGWSVCLRLA